MQVISNVDELREIVADWREADEHVALVATVGKLHQGHLSLVEVAKAHAEKIVVSIFVNPALVGEDDVDDSTRTLDRDKRRLTRAGADLIFAPDVDTIFPFGVDNATSVTVPALTDELCGEFRPGHFDGITTIVSRLFALVQPDVAILGQKDFQQQVIIRRMTTDLGMPIEIVTGPTVREDDGLAVSSGNQQLTSKERGVAPKLHETLHEIGESIVGGEKDFEKLEATAARQLEHAGFRPEYVNVRNASDLAVPDSGTRNFVVLASAWLGDARLTDNVVVEI